MYKYVLIHKDNELWKVTLNDKNDIISAFNYRKMFKIMNKFNAKECKFALIKVKFAINYEKFLQNCYKSLPNAPVKRKYERRIKE